jgi:hypothetical protein
MEQKKKAKIVGNKYRLNTVRGRSNTDVQQKQIVGLSHAHQA